MDEASYGIKLAVGAFATWRVTHLLSSEDGPFDVVVRVRVLLGHSLAGELMDCFNCFSLWIGAPMALFVTRHFRDWVLVWLALSGAACLLERLSREPTLIEPTSQFSEGDTPHVLRSETSGVAEQLESSNGADSVSSI